MKAASQSFNGRQVDVQSPNRTLGLERKQFETSAVADQQMNWWVTDTDGRKDRAVLALIENKGAHEHKESALRLILPP